MSSIAICRDPAAFFRGDTQTELADFWPYVFGGEMEPQAAKTYSDLMARSQELVAEDTLRSLDLSTVGTLLDVGGGSGAFLEQVGQAHPHVKLMLFDLEQVAPTAAPRFAAAGMDDRAQIACGSFKTDPIPKGADSISLIRVLYDHTDETVAMLLAKCWDSLPVGGRLFISEPMSGGAAQNRREMSISPCTHWRCAREKRAQFRKFRRFVVKPALRSPRHRNPLAPSSRAV